MRSLTLRALVLLLALRLCSYCFHPCLPTASRLRGCVVLLRPGGARVVASLVSLGFCAGLRSSCHAALKILDSWLRKKSPDWQGCYLMVMRSLRTIRAPATGSPARMAALILLLLGAGGFGSLHSAGGKVTPSSISTDSSRPW